MHSNGTAMHRALTFCVATLLALGMLATQADAKRRSYFIPIPGLSSGEKIVKVVDLPDKPALLRDDGKYIDLGYLHRTGGGEWVGYIGSSTSYVPLRGDRLQAFMRAAGLRELPPAPEKPSIFSEPLMIISVIIVVMALAWKLGKGLFSGAEKVSGRAVRHVVGTQENHRPRDWTDLDEKVQKAAERRKQAALAAKSQSAPRKPRTAQPERPAIQFGRDSAAVSISGSGGFGRRGR